jgi:hypothetical protein
MTTHQLAGVLDGLRVALGDALKAGAAADLGELAAAFRESPDQTVREFLKAARKPSPATPAAGADVAGVIEHIRKVRTGEVPPSVPTLAGLKTADLQQILVAFGKPKSGSKPDLTKRVEGLCAPAAPTAADPALPPGADAAAVDEGIRTYTRLRDDRSLAIPEVRSGFEALREYPKPVVEEIARRLNHPPHGTRADILDRLSASLIGVKVGQHRADQILTGT